MGGGLNKGNKIKDIFEKSSGNYCWPLEAFKFIFFKEIQVTNSNRNFLNNNNKNLTQYNSLKET